MARPGPGLLCPRCARPLTSAWAGCVALDACSQCGGVWLDNAASTQIVQAFDEAAIQAAERLAHGASCPVDTSVGGIPCPACRAPLVTRSVPAAGVDVDSCPAHGTWFDHDELRAISTAMALQRWQAGHRAAAAAGANVLAGGVSDPRVGQVAAGAPHAALDPRLGEALETTAEVVLEVAAESPQAGAVIVEVAAGAFVEGAAEVASAGAEAVLEGALALIGGILDGL